MTLQRLTHPASDVELAVRRTLAILFAPMVGTLLWLAGAWNLSVLWWPDWGNRIACFFCLGILGWMLPAVASWGVWLIFQKVLANVEHERIMARYNEASTSIDRGWH